MIRKISKKFLKNNCAGFTFIEIIVSLAIFSIILLFVVSFFFTMSSTNFKTKSDRDNIEAVRRVLDEMAFEIKSAKSIYTPTTTANQLSLETARYLSPNETSTFIDFFLCGNALCLKKEFQNPIVLTADSVKIMNITFLKILNGSTPSIKINLTLSHAGVTGSFDPGSSDIIYSVDLTSTAASRLGSALVEGNYTMGWVEAQPAGNINKNWTSVACSADGVKVVATAWGDYIYTSINSGATWTQQTSAGQAGKGGWQSVASDSTGAKLAAITQSDIWTSTNSGANWTVQSPPDLDSEPWTSIASSADGTKLAATNNGFTPNGNGDYIYTGVYSGGAWTWTRQTNPGLHHWLSIASDSTGAKLAAVYSGGNVNTSTDSGATWVSQTNSGLRNWQAIASDSTGTKLAAVVYGGYIYTGVYSAGAWTWTERAANLGLQSWSAIASSSNGNKLIAAAAGGRLYTSSNSGADWVEQQPAGNTDQNWRTVAINSDGSKFFAAVMGGRLYIGTFSP